jgi:hypothetical protein
MNAAALIVEKAEAAASHAGDAWKVSAYDALVAHAKLHPTFIVEDVRVSNPQLSAPSARAWGAIALRAKRNGVIRKCGMSMTRICTENSHPTFVALWESIAA